MLRLGSVSRGKSRGCRQGAANEDGQKARKETSGHVSAGGVVESSDHQLSREKIIGITDVAIHLRSL